MVGFFVFGWLYFLRNRTTPALCSKLKWVGVKVEVYWVGRKKFIVARVFIRVGQYQVKLKVDRAFCRFCVIVACTVLSFNAPRVHLTVQTPRGIKRVVAVTRSEATLTTSERKRATSEATAR